MQLSIRALGNGKRTFCRRIYRKVLVDFWDVLETVGNRWPLQGRQVTQVNDFIVISRGRFESLNATILLQNNYALN